MTSEEHLRESERYYQLAAAGFQPWPATSSGGMQRSSPTYNEQIIAASDYAADQARANTAATLAVFHLLKAEASRDGA